MNSGNALNLAMLTLIERNLKLTFYKIKRISAKTTAQFHRGGHICQFLSITRLRVLTSSLFSYAYANQCKKEIKIDVLQNKIISLYSSVFFDWKSICVACCKYCIYFGLNCFPTTFMTKVFTHFVWLPDFRVYFPWVCPNLQVSLLRILYF